MFVLIFLFHLSPSHNVKVFDTPNDKGGAVYIEWELSADDSIVSCYEVLRSENNVDYSVIATPLPHSNRFDDTDVKNGKSYWYKIRAVAGTDSSESAVFGPVHSSAQWFHHKRWNALVLSIILCGLALWYIMEAKKGKPLFIRRIAGLEAVDDAVGRSTEMGKPILYVMGLSIMGDIATIASLSILSRVAKRAAMHNTPLIVPCYDPIVMAACQETVKQAHLEAGRPDTYDESKIFFLTSDQFGYAAGVDGIIVRDKPGAIFLQGTFYAEALIISETGASVGAIQISGTPAITQLPFFVASCDYTLIGEEMFAASSYLSREPVMLGSIKGEDYSKLIIMIVMGIGILLATISQFGLLRGVAEKFIDWFTMV
ncbi:MAG: fibronectin type III domain-containing protein [Candidatus Stahlbacteria bacterium]|nr:fibronectin type III domain-containing protein [Candidatus Stahlbacteria bacterium]